MLLNYTYILECKDGTYYTGWTNNLEKRLKDHNDGKGAKYTKARRPVTLIYYEEFEAKEDAMRREYAIKQMTRSEKLQLINTTYAKKDIMDQLETFHVAQGHHVHVHSSLKQVGDVEGNGEGLLECLIEFFAQSQGMISFPTHTWDTNVLDLRKQETCTGTLSKLALRRNDGIRTNNPTHSMVIFGQGAKKYAKWDETATSSTSPEGCYGRLYEEDGYILLIGVGQNSNTYIHTVEERLNVPDRITKDKANTFIIEENGNKICKPMHLVFEEYGDISYQFDKLEPAFRYHGCIIDGKIGNAKVQLCSARKMTEVLTMIHEKSQNIELFLDNEPLPETWYKE